MRKPDIMRLLPTILLLSITLHLTTARCKRPRPSPVMGALQSILSPANAERTMQMLSVATQQSLANSVGTCNPPLPPQIPVKYSPPILPFPEPCNTPINVQASNTYVLPNPVQMPTPIPLPPPYPVQVQMPNPISYQMPAQLLSPPTQLPIQVPNPVPLQLPSPPLQIPYQVPQLSAPVAPIIPEVVIERPFCSYEREIIYPSPEIPNWIYEYNAPVASIPEVIAPIPLTSAQDTYTCPFPSPAALFTVPAASCSSCMQDNTGTRSQYLRKIPIPPPTL